MRTKGSNYRRLCRAIRCSPGRAIQLTVQIRVPAVSLGTEYGAWSVDDIFASGVDTTQLLIEFHHRFPKSGIGRTRQAVAKLSDAGYQISCVSDADEECSSIRRH